MTEMRVLSVLPLPVVPSGMVFARRQIESLEKLGVENRSFFIPSKNLSLLSAFRSFGKLRKEIRSFKPDIIHVHYGLLYAFMAAFSSLRPLVITFQGSDINTIRSRSLFRNVYGQILSNLAGLRARILICVSPNLLKNIRWGKNKVIIVPPGINTEVFREMDREQCRGILGWNREDKVVLFNANNPVVKRLDLAKETLEYLVKEIPGARLEVLDGTLEDDSRIPVLLNASDALLICSDSEGSPTMVKEALACNCPVVGVDVGDVRQRLEGVNRCVVAEKDPLKLAVALKQVVGSGRSADGRKKLLSDGLSEEETAKKILRIYEQIRAGR
jgi:glycosyltransferase involved in cell wall biosynthesis